MLKQGKNWHILKNYVKISSYMQFIFFTLLFLLAISIGSFVAAWVSREHRGLSIWKGRSSCVDCGYALRALDLIPILSFLFLKGKCRKCKVNLSKHYIVIELLMGLLFLFFGVFYKASFDFVPIQFAISLFASVFLIAIFVSDFLYQEIPFSFTIFPAISIFLANFFLHFQDWKSMALGGIIAAGFFAIQFVVSKGKWIGGGDIALGLFMGVLLGFPKTILALALAYICGALLGTFLLLTKKVKGKTEIHFGTFLAVAMFISMLWGERMIAWYLSLI
jgi:leader peptidase (prepilin peptidase)/N-methyltransferase